ncbi:retrotransposon protein, putative, ty1-copia subclass, partial [Tanacetum coccineum]
MACKPKPRASICAFVLEMKRYFDRLESLNMAIDAELSINKILSAAPVLTVGHNAKKRKTSHSNWKGKAAKGKSDCRSKKKVESDIAPTSDLKEVVYFYCNTKGHWKGSYPKYLKDLKDRKVEKCSHSEDKISDSTLSKLDKPANYKENLVHTTPDLKTVGCKWIFKKKTDMDEKVHTYKARLVEKGYTQTHEIDYEETFSPVAKIKSISIMLAIVAFHDYEIWQMDVKTAFLNRKLTEDVFMAQPEGFENTKYPKRVCKLQKAIYGLKQASRSWNL